MILRPNAALSCLGCVLPVSCVCTLTAGFLCVALPLVLGWLELQGLFPHDPTTLGLTLIGLEGVKNKDFCLVVFTLGTLCGLGMACEWALCFVDDDAGGCCGCPSLSSREEWEVDDDAGGCCPSPSSREEWQLV